MRAFSEDFDTGLCSETRKGICSAVWIVLMTAIVEFTRRGARVTSGMGGRSNMLDLRVCLQYIDHEVVGVGVENVGETGIWGGSM